MQATLKKHPIKGLEWKTNKALNHDVAGLSGMVTTPHAVQAPYSTYFKEKQCMPSVFIDFIAIY
jgi:hypothetical protein